MLLQEEEIYADLLLRKASSPELEGRRDDERSALDAALRNAEEFGKPRPLARVRQIVDLRGGRKSGENACFR